MDHAENEQAIQDLIRKIHINAFMSNKKSPEPTGNRIDNKFMSLHKEKSTWNPPISAIPESVRAFTKELEKELREAPHNKNKPKNLTHREKIGLRRLKNHRNLIIKLVNSVI